MLVLEIFISDHADYAQSTVEQVKAQQASKLPGAIDWPIKTGVPTILIL